MSNPVFAFVLIIGAIGCSCAVVLVAWALCLIARDADEMIDNAAAVLSARRARKRASSGPLLTSDYRDIEPAPVPAELWEPREGLTVGGELRWSMDDVDYEQQLEKAAWN